MKKDRKNIMLTLAAVLPVVLLAVLGYVFMADIHPGGAVGEGSVWASVILDMGDGRVFEYNITANYTTAYGFLLAACSPENANFTVSATYYSMYDSLLVESVDNRSNGDEGRYWQYWINGEQIWVGADKTEINDGVVIRWSFEEMNF